MKICNYCKENKMLECFYADNKSRDGLSYRCKECDNKRSYASTFKRRYGVTVEYKQKIIDAQGNCCPICDYLFDDNPKHIHLDHNHKTEQIRGVLCFNCNRLLGWYENNKERIEAYLEKYKMRPEFDAIIEGWNATFDIDDIPSRLKQLDKLKPYSNTEAALIRFMRDVQMSREKLQGKKAK